MMAFSVNARIDADTERDWYDCGDSKSRVAYKRPQGVTNVVPHVREHLGPFFRNRQLRASPPDDADHLAH
jgi:hypothetical protein